MKRLLLALAAASAAFFVPAQVVEVDPGSYHLRIGKGTGKTLSEHPMPEACHEAARLKGLGDYSCIRTDAVRVVPAPPTVALWSDARTWGGSMPTAGAEVVIPPGKTVVLDTETPALAGLRIEGTLRIERGTVALNAGYIDVTGEFLVGSQDKPFTGKATITLDGPNVEPNNGVSRGLMVNGGRLEFYGVAPIPAWTKLDDHAAAGATELRLKDATDWKAGDLVVIAPTDFYGQTATERLPLAGSDGAGLTLSVPLKKFRWGELQYITSKGMSLTPEDGYTPPVTPAPTVLDERAAVGNLSRNIVIQGADDEAWKSGFGAHVMVMDLKSKVVIDGVEFRRVGQSGVTGRYPMHWHLLSYAEDGTLIGDATGHEIRNSTVWNSANRCIVIHGTNGVAVRNNICQDVKGHSFFLEDAVERRNVIEGNLALTNRTSSKPLQVHEKQIFQAGPSGFWLTNPDNVVRGNHAGDAQGNGFWLAFPRKALGLSANVVMKPDRLAHGVFENNTAHSARGPGVMLDFPPIDAAGNVNVNFYVPTSDGLDERTGNSSIGFDLNRVTSFKNLDGAYRNRATKPRYAEWVTADNVGAHFAGSVSLGILQRSLVIGTSLNAGTYPNAAVPPAAFASYHGSLLMQDNTVVEFPFVEGKPSGAFMTDDYYLVPVDKTTIGNPGNRLINSHPGFRTPPAHILPTYTETNRNHFTLSGALHDPHGYWGPAGNWWVYDLPFLTEGATCVWVAPEGKNGKSCDGKYFGVGALQTDFDNRRFDFAAPIRAVRLDDAGNEIGRWQVDDGATSSKLPHMRHFATRPGGRYVLTFPNKPVPKWVAMTVTNAFEAGSSFLMAVSFDGTLEPTGYAIAGWEHRRDDPKTWKGTETYAKHARFFKPAGSLADVEAGDGSAIWQDKANNLVWFKFVGGLPYPGDPGLYGSYGVVIYSKVTQ